MLAPPRPSALLNREISRLDYNRRVLARASDPSMPLAERVDRFLEQKFRRKAGKRRAGWPKVVDC